MYLYIYTPWKKNLQFSLFSYGFFELDFFLPIDCHSWLDRIRLF